MSTHRKGRPAFLEAFMATSGTQTPIVEADSFLPRHIGPNDAEMRAMLRAVGYATLDDLVDATIPESIRFRGALSTGEPMSERDVLAELRAVALQNRMYRSYIGMGYADTFTPPVIQRNILENPGWYTAYTPYQAEIAQGRLEALLNFQTVVIDLTGLEIANASLLDEGTAAAEAMTLAYGARGKPGKETFFVSGDCHPQTIDVVRTRAHVRGITVEVGDHRTASLGEHLFGVLLQYPATDGAVYDYRALCERAHAAGALVVAATDLLALALLAPPGEWGADIAVGSSQRFGVPLGYGGPHAAFFATRDEFRRQLPGRIIGVSRDADGRAALRMALQTREQHIRREKATSNVCTAQVLLAVIAGMYAVWHGPDGVRRIAATVHKLAALLAAGAERLGHRVAHDVFFDTVRVELAGRSAADVVAAADARRINVRVLGPATVCIALDEMTRVSDVGDLIDVLNGGERPAWDVEDLAEEVDDRFDERFARTSEFLTHPVFNTHHSETELLRYMRLLESRDLSLTHSMIPLGSCTMKLNATAEMFPVTWPEFGKLHPFVPVEQAQGYQEMFGNLEVALAEITGFHAVSLQPNAGSQGEYAGLLTIAAYHRSRGDTHRTVCLIPQSAHGTNPASAVMAGMTVIVTKTDANGNIDVADFRAKAEKHATRLAACMITYPSTHGVFEEAAAELCAITHGYGGQVYLDGANLNALVGLARPGDIGADVSHLNLHKTFCIPHGGGGPGMGPIGVKAHLIPFLPGHPETDGRGHTVSAAPYGSASILPISWSYCLLMGGRGLTQATRVAILNANYIAKRLEGAYVVLYKGARGRVAHECIIDTRPLFESAGVTVDDIAKRLIDCGFHAPTMSWPVPGTLMIEPTESETKAELDRFCSAMLAIREEARTIEEGRIDPKNNPLKNAPHTVEDLIGDWNRPYSREAACFPPGAFRVDKYWPPVNRVDNVFGDRNLVCSCPPLEAYDEAAE